MAPSNTVMGNQVTDETNADWRQIYERQTEGKFAMCDSTVRYPYYFSIACHRIRMADTGYRGYETLYKQIIEDVASAFSAHP